MRLTELTIKNTQCKDKPYKIFDGGGLYLLIKSTGRYWRYKYRYYGREKCLSIGTYPSVSLKRAREIHREARCLLDNGKCPATEKQRLKNEKINAQCNTFAVIAQKWYDMKKSEWTNPKHAKQVITTLTREVFPYMGGLPISEITPMLILDTLNKIKGKPETYTRIKQRITAVFDYGIQTGRTSWNPA